LQTAFQTRVAAGAALAVDRAQFSQKVNEQLYTHPLIERIEEQCHQPPLDSHDYCIVAAGPLASEPLTAWLIEQFGQDRLSFYDAIAPIVAFDSIDTSICFYGERHRPEGSDYLNCPFSEEQYQLFYDELMSADRVHAREFEDARYFEACLPVEVIAERGYQSLLFGTLRPVGLVDPRTGKRPFAVCQLRRETASGESFSLVGFQTRLRIKDQQHVFRLMPGLEHAEFMRYGSIHRNTYLDSPRLLGSDLSFKKIPNLFLGGQLNGGEGYTESIATGHLCARAVLARMQGKTLPPPPPATALGSLLGHITASSEKVFTPSHFNFGLLPALELEGKRIAKKNKKELLYQRALEQLRGWAAENTVSDV
jgi:methylenetetrahydrofolate--tRNA-(uracil-5-)-methyltransferase